VFVLIDLAAAEEYAALLGITYDTMKQAYPTMTILGGSLASADTEYLDAMYAAWGEGPAKFDHLALHPYSRVDGEAGPHHGKAQYPDQCNASDNLAPPWCYKQGVANIRQLLDAKGHSNKEIWFTEFGTSSSSEYGHAGNEGEQQEHMKRALDILSEWFSMNDAMKIPVAITYRLEDEGSDLFGLYETGLPTAKPVGQEIARRIDSQGKLITCDTTVNIENAQWTMLSLPCKVPSGKTIEDLFADDVLINGQPGSYDNDWVVYIFNSELSEYEKSGLQDTLVPGQGFWFIQLSGNSVTLDLPPGSQVAPSHVPGGACQSQLGCIGLSLSGAPNDGARWNLLGNPFSAGVVTNKLTVLTNSGACSGLQDGCDLAEAAAANILHDSLWVYNENGYEERTGSMVIDSWDGFWAAELPAAAGLLPSLQVPVPDFN
jgi:hypothetical protein